MQELPLEKIYHALVAGWPKQEEGRIDAPIARRPLPSLLRFVSKEGKPSVTEYQVLQRWDNCCQLELRPITGRTHQLRVHCAYEGFPIVGDPQYVDDRSENLAKGLGLSYQQLCAKSIRFHHPVTKQELYVESQWIITASGAVSGISSSRKPHFPV